MWSALVLGATTPDVGYFLKLQPGATWGPTFLGAFTFCMPVGALMFVLFYRLLKRPLTLVLPRGLRKRAWPLASQRLVLSAPFVARVLLSLLIAAWSHQVWDAFTHGYGWGLRMLPFLGSTPLVGAVVPAVLRGQDQRGVDLLRKVAGALAIGGVSLGVLAVLAVGAFLTVTGETTEPPSRGQ